MQDKPYYQEEYKGRTIKIYPDENVESPRTWDNLGTMVTWHSRSHLGDKNISRDDIRDFLAELAEVNLDDKEYDLSQLLSKARDKHVILPLYLYEHGSMTMKTTPFSCPWDSGQVGFIYVSFEKAKKECMGKWKYITKGRHERIQGYLQGEVETFDDYLTGNVFGYVVEEDGEHLESCWGYYGDPTEDDAYIMSEARGIVDYYVEQEAKAEAIMHL